MNFMQQQVVEATYFTIETTAGTECVPAFVVGRTQATTIDTFVPYLEGNITDANATLIEPQHGWVARLSAPGYTDCTDWTAHVDEDHARAYLDMMYGEE